MFNPLLLFSEYFFSFLVLLTACILVGGFAIHLFDKNKQLSVENTFYASLIGSIIITSIYAIYTTHFSTIHTCFLLLTAFLIYYRTIIISEVKLLAIPSVKSSAKYIIILTLFLTFFAYTIYFVITYNFENNTINSFWIDDYFYGVVAKSMIDNHKENTLYALNYFDKNTSNSFYHFFEIWIGGMMYDIFKLNSLLALRLIVLPFCLFNFLLGCIAFVEYLYQKSMRIELYLIGIAGLGICSFLSPIKNLPLIQNFHEQIFFGISPLKHSIIIIFALALFINLHRKQYYQALFWALSIPILSFTAFPFVIGGALIFVYGCLLLKWLPISKKYVATSFSILPIYIILHSILIFIVGFYLLKGEAFTDNITKDPFIIKQYIDAFISLLFGSILKYQVLSYSLFFLPIFFAIKTYKSQFIFDFKPITIILVLFTIAGLSSATLMCNDINGNQLLNIPFITFVRVFFTLLILQCLHKYHTNNNQYRFYILSFIVILLANNLVNILQYTHIVQSTVDVNFIKEVVQKRKNGDDILVSIANPITSEEDNYWGLGWHTQRPALMDAYERETLYLDITNIYDKISANQNIPNKLFPNYSTRNLYNSIQQQNPFYRFMLLQKEMNLFKSVEESQVEFLKKYKVRRILVAQNFQPSATLQRHITNTITDKNNTLKLLIVNF